MQLTLSVLLSQALLVRMLLRRGWRWCEVANAANRFSWFESRSPFWPKACQKLQGKASMMSISNRQSEEFKLNKTSYQSFRLNCELRIRSFFFSTKWGSSQIWVQFNKSRAIECSASSSSCSFPFSFFLSFGKASLLYSNWHSLALYKRFPFSLPLWSWLRIRTTSPTTRSIW